MKDQIGIVQFAFLDVSRIPAQAFLQPAWSLSTVILSRFKNVWLATVSSSNPWLSLLLDSFHSFNRALTSNSWFIIHSFSIICRFQGWSGFFSRILFTQTSAFFLICSLEICPSISQLPMASCNLSLNLYPSVMDFQNIWTFFFLTISAVHPSDFSNLNFCFHLICAVLFFPTQTLETNSIHNNIDLFTDLCFN